MAAKRRYVIIPLEGEILEDPAGGSFLSSKKELQFRVLVQSLREIGRRPRLERVVLVIKNLSLNWNQAEEIHRELDALRTAGKQCWAYLEQGDNVTYYLASAAQKVFLPPHSSLNLVGLRLELYFFHDLLAQWGVSPQLFNKGRYKSAAEMFTRTEMSEANREASQSILEDYGERLVERVGRRLEATPEQVRKWIDDGPYSSARALSEGLVDDLLYEDQIEERLREESPGIRPTPFAKLSPRENALTRLLFRWRPGVAYLAAEGLITEGRSRRSPGRPPTVGSDTVREMLESARKNKRIRAVLLRINSPGGSALASELIWRAIRKTAEEKPVIVSMAGVAASGGYYMACAADKVLAMPSTLTGSIGVVGGKFSVADLLSRFGVGVDSVERGAHAGANSPARPYSEEEIEIVRRQLDDVYEAFVSRVAEGRRRSPEEILESAEGRVWTGAQACRRKLVDELGGVNAALDAVRAAAGIGADKKIRVVTLAVRRKLRDYLSLPLTEASAPDVFAGWFSWVEKVFSSRVWTVLPVSFRIR